MECESIQGIKIGGGDIKRPGEELWGGGIKREQKEQVSPCTKDPKKITRRRVSKNGRREEIIRECPCCFRSSCRVSNIMVSLNIEHTPWSDIHWTKWLRQIWRPGPLWWDMHTMRAVIIERAHRTSCLNTEGNLPAIVSADWMGLRVW